MATFKNMPDTFWINIAQNDYRAIKYIKNPSSLSSSMPSKEILEHVIKNNRNAFELVKEQYQTP